MYVSVCVCKCVSVCCAYLTTLVPPLITCMSTLQTPFECEMRLTSENSACEDEKEETRQFHQLYKNHYYIILLCKVRLNLFHNYSTTCTTFFVIIGTNYLHKYQIKLCVKTELLSLLTNFLCRGKELTVWIIQAYVQHAVIL